MSFCRSLLFVTALCVGTVAAAAVDQSLTPPNGISVNNAPMFVAFGCDDNPKDEGVNWLVNFLDGKKNADGSTARMSFFVNGSYTGDAYESWRAALAAGHEIGNHTQTHFPDHGGDTASLAIWASEIAQTAALLTGPKVGMPTAAITGFRTPYLEYNPATTFNAIVDAGMSYDCSIEQGVGDTAYNGTNASWPYTLDNGSPDNALVPSIPGLWELPVQVWVIPPDSVCARLGLAYSLRDSLAIRMPGLFDTLVNSITGLDYNVMLNANYGDTSKWYDGGGVDSTEYAAILRYNFEQRKNNNRAPFTLGIHSQFYITSWNSNSTKMTALQRQGVIEDFVDYVLADTTVRVVPYGDIVKWMKAPVGLDGTGAAAGPYTVTTNAGPGQITVSPASATFNSGDVVTLIAQPDSGFLFSSFTGDVFGTNDTLTFTITGNVVVNACFVGFESLRAGCDTTLSVDMLANGTWGGDCDASSNVTKSGIVTGGVAKINYTMGQMTGDVWPWIDITSNMPTATYKNFGGMWKIRISYKSAQEIILALPTPASTDADYCHWQVTLAPTGTETVTKEYTWERFAQPSWTHDTNKVALDLSKVTFIAFAPSIETATGAVTDSLFISELKVIGLNPAGTDEPISGVLASKVGVVSRPSLASLTRSGVSFNLPTAGTYSFRLLSLDGRTLLTVPQTRYAAGTVRMPLNGLASGMYVSIIESAKSSIVQRAMLTR